MKKFLLILFIIVVTISCRKRNGNFQFAGVWIIQKVEQVKYVDSQQTLDSAIKNDTLGWFAFYNGIEGYSLAKTKITFTTFSGLGSNEGGKWVIDEHEGDRLIINGIIYTRERIVGGEKWTWVASLNSGSSYSRETIFVKKK